MRVTKSSYLDVVRTVRVEPGGTASMEAWLSPRSEVEVPAASQSEPDEVQAATYPSGSYASSDRYPSDTYLDDAFCDTLEQVLSACPDQFRDIVVPSRSRTWTFLEPTVALAGAWYNKVYRAAPGRCEYLASFDTDLAASPGRRLEAFVSRVESCLPAGMIAWHQRRPMRHLLEVDLDRGNCQVDVAVSGETVDLEIYEGAR